MKFTPAPLEGAWVVEPNCIEDERGFFARTYCQDEFRNHGLSTAVAQSSISWNAQRGTLRGMHYQAAPHEEEKLVRCTQGAVWDVIVDIRPHSAKRFTWFAIELSAANRRALYIPKGFAHGFQTLLDESEVLYQISEFYKPESARGLRWSDPRLDIAWPIAAPIISPRDQAFPLLP